MKTDFAFHMILFGRGEETKMYSSIFSAFLQEAQFTKELLAIGVTQLYKANHATKGTYYQAFTCLSTGIERAAKLCLILDFYITNNGALPQENHIRKYGHKIMNLFQSCCQVAERQQINFHFSHKLNDEIHQSILQVLTVFAQSSGRYSNINTLLGKSTELDCMHQWYKTVDLKLYEKCVSFKKKQGIENRAEVIGTLLKQFAVVHFSGEDTAEVSDTIEASKRTGIWEAVAPYRQLYMLQIIRFFTEILMELSYKAMNIHPGDIPYFSEIFGIFYNGDKYFKSRKTWDKL